MMIHRFHIRSIGPDEVAYPSGNKEGDRRDHTQRIPV